MFCILYTENLMNTYIFLIILTVIVTRSKMESFSLSMDYPYIVCK